MLIAHRGFRTPKSENTMQDFLQALEICKGVEFDIRLTKDKKVIIFHDDDFKRIGNDDRFVSELNFDEIINLYFFEKNPSKKPPLFDEFIRISERYEFINVEIKEDINRPYSDEDINLILSEIKTLTEKTKAEVVISSFDLKILNYVINNKLLAPKVKIGYLFEFIKEFDEELAQKVDYIHPSVSESCLPEMIEIFKKLDKPLNIWTFKRPEEAKKIKEIYGDLAKTYISDTPHLFE